MINIFFFFAVASEGQNIALAKFYNFLQLLSKITSSRHMLFVLVVLHNFIVIRCTSEHIDTKTGTPARNLNLICSTLIQILLRHFTITDPLRWSGDIFSHLRERRVTAKTQNCANLLLFITSCVSEFLRQTIENQHVLIQRHLLFPTSLSNHR